METSFAVHLAVLMLAGLFVLFGRMTDSETMMGIGAVLVVLQIGIA